MERASLMSVEPPRPLAPETLAAQAMGEIDPTSGGLAPSINPSTNYEMEADGSYHQDRVYTRADNPTYDYSERLLASLEGGCGCALFASGMAASIAVYQSLLPGDHVLVASLIDQLVPISGAGAHMRALATAVEHLRAGAEVD
jgi:cystathionine gamma-synthase